MALRLIGSATGEPLVKEPEDKPKVTWEKQTWPNANPTKNAVPVYDITRTIVLATRGDSRLTSVRSVQVLPLSLLGTPYVGNG